MKNTIDSITIFINGGGGERKKKTVYEKPSAPLLFPKDLEVAANQMQLITCSSVNVPTSVIAGILSVCWSENVQVCVNILPRRKNQQWP